MAVKFAIIDNATGKVIQTGYCNPKDLELQAQAGQLAIDTTEEPEIIDHHWQYDLAKTSWVKGVTDLQQAKDNTILQLEGATSTKIASDGFTSSATGVALTYPSGQADQVNMQQAALVGGLLSVQASDGTWSYVDHSAAQAVAVLKDFVTFKDAQRTALADAIEAVNAAATVDDVKNIPMPVASPAVPVTAVLN